MRAELRLDGSRLERYLQRAKTDGRVAAARALNRTMQTVQSRAGKVIAEDVGLPQRRVREAMRLTNARPDKLQAELAITGKRIPLADFGARGPEPSRARGRGVTYRIGRRGRQHVPGGFLARMRSGHRGVFVRGVAAGVPSPRQFRRVRRGQTFAPRVARLPIRELFGPSLPRVASEVRVDDITRAAERPNGALDKNLEHELRFLARQGGAA